MIYKYFKATEYSMSGLIRDELYCQNYQSFNDPFECWFILKEGIPNIEKEPERFKIICDAWGFHPDDDKENGPEYYNLYMEELENYQPDIKGYIDEARISCFSKKPDNLLMWSHYADGLRGFCIGFDEKLILENEKKYFAAIIPVLYSKEPPIVDKMIYALANDQIWYNEMAIGEDHEGKYRAMYQQGLRESKRMLNNLFKKTIATKPFEWKYEQEVRLVFHSGDCAEMGYFFSYPSNAIKTIHFGERMNIKTRETLIKIIDSKINPIPKTIAKRNYSDYKIEFCNF